MQHDEVWARILSVAVAVAALTMLAVALAIVMQPQSRVIAAVYGAFAVVLLVLAIVVDRLRIEPKIAIVGMAVVAANVIVAIGAALR